MKKLLLAFMLIGFMGQAQDVKIVTIYGSMSNGTGVVDEIDNGVRFRKYKLKDKKPRDVAIEEYLQEGYEIKSWLNRGAAIEIIFIKN